nr:polyprotein [Squash vein yellowing virus]
MAQVYDFKATTKFEKYLVGRHGVRAFQQYRDYVPPSQARSKFASFTVPEGVLYAYVAAFATEEDVRDVLKLTPGALKNYLVEARRSISSNCDMDFSDGRTYCECGAELRPAKRKTCEDCGFVYKNSESELAKRIYNIASTHECQVSDLQYFSRSTLVEMVEEADAYDAREKLAAGLTVKQEEEKPDLSHIPVKAAIAIAELEQKPTEKASEKEEEVAVKTQTILIGDVVVPLLPVEEIPIIRGEKSDLQATGFSLESEEEEIRELQTKQAVVVALEVGNQIAEVCKINELRSNNDNLNLMKVIYKHRMHTLEMRKEVRARVEKDKAIFKDLEMKLNLRNRRKNQIIKKDSRGTSRWRRRETLSKKRVQIPENIITEIANDHQESRIEECVLVPGIKCATSKKMPKKRLLQQFLKGSVDDLILQTIQLCKQERKVIEVIGKRGVKINCGATTIVELKHMKGKMSKRDMPCDDFVDSFFSKFIKKLSRARTEWSICRGDSGSIVQIGSKFGIVRGRLDGYLVDARDILSLRELLDIDEYSSTGMKCIKDQSSIDDFSKFNNDSRMQLWVKGNSIFAKDEMAAENFLSKTVWGGIFRNQSGVYKNPAIMLRRAARYGLAFDCALEAYECPMCGMQCTYLESFYFDCDFCEYTYKVPPSDKGLPATVPIEPIDYVASSSIRELMKESWIVGGSEEIIIEKDFRTPTRVVRTEKFGLRSQNFKFNLLEETSNQWLINAIIAADNDLNMFDVHTVQSRAFPTILLKHMFVRDFDDDMSQEMRDLLMRDNASNVFSTYAETTVGAITYGWSGIVITKKSIKREELDKVDWVNDLCVIQGRRKSDGRIENALVTKTREELADIDLYSFDLKWAKSKEAFIEHFAESPEQLIKTCCTPSALWLYAKKAQFYKYVDYLVLKNSSLVDLAVKFEYVGKHLGMIETVEDTCIEFVHFMEESIMAAGLQHSEELSRVRALIKTHFSSVRESNRYELIDRVVEKKTHLCAEEVIMRELIRHTYKDLFSLRERLLLKYGSKPARLQDFQRKREEACSDTCSLFSSLMSRVGFETLQDWACKVVKVNSRRVHDATDSVIRFTFRRCCALVKACAFSWWESNVNRIFTAVISLIILTFISKIYSLIKSVFKYEKQKTQKLEDGQIELQGKKEEAFVLKWCAFLTLLMSFFNFDWALASTTAIGKLKTLYGVLGSEIVELQSGDEDSFRFVNFEVEAPGDGKSADIQTFKEWFEHCMKYNLTTPEPTTSGPLLTLKRGAARDLAEVVRTHEKTDMRIFGGVGSGKSTHLPSELMKFGAVLICVPTRVLANALHESFMALFGYDVSLAYRGRVRTGTQPITIMTYGYALNHFHYNPNALKTFEYIVMDEIHTFPTEMSPLFSLIRELSPHKKIIKTSATHVGHHVELTTNHKVDIETLPLLSPKQWADMQGTGVHGDATVRGNIILVFVGCYNQVDECSEALRLKGFPVLKVDGRNFRKNTEVQKMVDELEGEHKFIVATNIIENGVTFDVDTVVDFGERVSPVLDSAGRSIILQKKRISMAERQQRFGRVGRMKPGVAYKFGNAQLPDSMKSTVGATESALISFAYGVKPVVDDVDVHCIANVTKKQALAASMFDLNRIFTVHHIDKHGFIPRPVFEQVKKFVLKTDAIAVCENYMAAHTSEWQPLHSYIRRNSDNDHVSSVRIPWFCSDMSQDFIVKIAEAVQLAKPKFSCSYAIDNVDFHVVAHKISVGEHNIEEAKSLVTEILNNVKRWRDNLVYRMSTPRNNSLMALMVGWIPKKIEKTRELLDTRIRRLEMLLVQLDNVSVTSDYDALMRFFSENPHSAEYLESQSKVDYLEEKVLQINQRKVDWRVIGGLFLVTTTVAGALYWYLRRKRVEEHIELQGRNNLRFKRDKRTARFVFDGEDQDMVETFGIEYSDDVIQKKMTKRQKQRAASNSGWKIGKVDRVKRVFHQLYGVNPLEFDKVYMTVGDLMGNEWSTNEKWTVEDLIVDMDDEFGVGRRGDLETEVVQIHFKRDDSNEEKVVTLTPHRSKMASCMSLNPMGFPEEEGRWRQTGKPVDCVRVKKDESPGKIELQVGFPTTAAPYAHLFHRLGRANYNGLALNTVFHGNKCIIPYHLGKNGSSDKHVIITTPRGQFDFGPFSNLRCKKLGDFDIVIINNPRDLQPFKESSIFRMPKMDEEVVPIALRGEKGKLIARVGEASKTYRAGAEYSHLWVYFYPANAGDCGSAIVARADNKIVGFHSGIVRDDKGVYLRSVYTPVSELLLQALKEKCDDDFWTFDHRNISWNALVKSSTLFPITKEIQEIEVQGGVGEKYIGDNLMIVGEVQKQVYHNHVIKGKRASFEEFCERNVDCAFNKENLKERYGPSILSTGAFYKDFLKYDEPIAVGLINFPCLINAYLNVENKLLDLGFEGNCGPEWDPYVIYQDLNKKAAMGALYAGKKQEWLDSIQPQEFIECVKHSYQMLGMGAVGVWSGSLKAELRSREKIAEGKTRVFTGAPIDVLLAGKVLVDNFNNYFYSQHLKGPWSVGINKFNRGWDRLANTFDHTWKFIDCDGSRFDSSLSPVLFQLICHLRERFGTFDKGETRALRNLYSQIVYTPILTIDGYIVKKHKGNNSGQPSTVVDNTLILMIVVEYCRSVIKNNTGIEMKFKYMCNGDDLIINAPQDEISVIQERFAKLFKDCGLNYNFNDVHDSIEEVEYMSHKFMKKDGIYIPKLCRERIVAILEWERSDELFRTRSALNAAFIESFGYSDLQDDIKKFANFWANKHGIQYPLLSDERVEKLYMDENFSLGELDMEALMPDIFTFGEIELQAFDLAAKEAEIQKLRDEWDANKPSVTLSPFAAKKIQNPLAEKVKELLKEIEDAGEKTKKRPCGEPNEGEEDSDGEDEAKDKGKNVTTPDKKQILKGGGSSKPIVKRDDVDNIPTNALEFKKDFKPARVSRTGFTWIPRSQRDNLTPEVVKNFLAYVPPSQAIDNQMASGSEVESWAIRTAEAYGITIQSFYETILPAWIVNCIINGTSEERKSESTWRAVELNNKGEDVDDMEYPMEPIFKHALPTMRKIMRNFSDQAILMYQNSVQQGKAFNVKAARNAGYTRVEDLWLGIDFMAESQLSRHQLNIKHQILAANVGRADKRLFALSAPGEEGRVNTERHTTNDVSADRHSYSGAALT